MEQRPQHPLIKRAIECLGGQEQLAAAIDCAQQHVSKLLNRQRRVSAETAHLIERATGGKVTAHELRPDCIPAARRARRSTVAAEQVPA